METQYRAEYLRLTDIEKRKKLMEQWVKVDEKGSVLYKQVFDYRYQVRSEADTKDYFIRGWVLLCGLKNGISVKLNRHTKQMMDEIKECFALKAYYEADAGLKEVFYQEYVNMTEFYIELAFRDRSYSSGFLGLMKMDESRIKEKLAKEIYAIAYHVPKKLHCFEEMKPVREAMCQGFKNKFEDDSKILEKVIYDNEIKN